MKIRIAQASGFCWNLTSEFQFILQTNDLLSCSSWGRHRFKQTMEQLAGGLKSTHGIIYQGELNEQ